MASYFLLRTGGQSSESSIYLRLREGNQETRINTKIKVEPRDWNPEQQRVVASDRLYKYKNAALASWFSEAEKALLMMHENRWTINEAKEYILKNKGIEEPKRNYVKDKSSFLQYYHKWATTRTETRRVLSRQSLTTYNLLKEFRPNLSFKDINYNFYLEFAAWLDNVKHYKTNTKGATIKRIKAAMNAALKEGLHDNQDFKNFRTIKEEVDNVYLTEEELDRLYEAQLTGYKAKARDIFLVGCYTAMRWSDYSRLTMADVHNNAIYFVHKKTGQRVSVPLSPIVREILEKYDGAMPKLSDVKLNKYIKEVCKDVGIDTPYTKVYTKGGERVVVTQPKYMFVSTHTARRTGATNMIKAGAPAYNVMLITGHTSEATFWNYVKLEKETNAEYMRGLSFFQKGKK